MKVRNIKKRALECMMQAKRKRRANSSNNAFNSIAAALASMMDEFVEVLMRYPLKGATDELAKNQKARTEAPAILDSLQGQVAVLGPSSPKL